MGIGALRIVCCVNIFLTSRSYICNFRYIAFRRSERCQRGRWVGCWCGRCSTENRKGEFIAEYSRSVRQWCIWCAQVNMHFLFTIFFSAAPKCCRISSKYIKSGLLPNLKFLFSGFPNRRLTRIGELHSKYKLWRIELLYRYKRAKTSRVTVLNSENCFFNFFTLNRMFTLSGSHQSLWKPMRAQHPEKRLLPNWILNPTSLSSTIIVNLSYSFLETLDFVRLHFDL